MAGGTGGAAGPGGGSTVSGSELTASPTLAPHSRPAQYQPASSPLTASPAANILPPTPMVRLTPLPNVDPPSLPYSLTGLSLSLTLRLCFSWVF